MSRLLRCVLTFGLSTSALGCDEERSSGLEPRGATLTAADVVTVRLGTELEPVGVSSYSLDERTAQALERAGYFDGRLLTEADLKADQGYVIYIDGVVPLIPGSSDALVELRGGEEIVAYPYESFIVSVYYDGDGTASTVLTLDGSPEPAVWGDDTDSPRPAVVEPVSSFEYELVASDGTSTTCEATAATDQAFIPRFALSETGEAHASVAIADRCGGILEEAANRKPPEAFFVRCDRGTMSTIVGVHAIGNLTLKRGRIDVVGKPIKRQR